jgi:tetratricopeptide (TPR) repeat protein
LKKLIISGAAIAVALAASSIQYIPSGRSGAVERQGRIEVLESGLHFSPPWDRAATYPVEPSNMVVNNRAEVPAGEVVSEFQLEISVKPSQVAAFHRSQGRAWKETLIDPLLGEFLKRSLVSANKAPGEISPGDLERKINDDLSAALEPYGLALHSTHLVSLDTVENEQTARIAEFARANGGRVVIIGSDAFDWQIYEEVSKQIPMPNIEKLRTDGATGMLMSMEPLVSPMIWTSMATGTEPQVHGIIDFVTTDEETGENIPITSTMRRVPALWNILTRYGLSSGFIGWLGTYPAEAVLGFMVSDRIVFHTFDPRWQKADQEKAYDNTAGLAYPDDLIEEIEPMISGHGDVGLARLREYIDIAPGDIQPAASTFDRLDPVRNLRLILSSGTTYEEIARYTYGKYQPDLFSVYLDEVDNVCHLFIKHMAPPTADVSASDAARYGRAVAATYARVDTLIGEWMKMIDEETTLMLISDHGFKSGDIRPKGASAVGGGQAVNWHRIAGAIALYGNGVRSGATLEDASVLDITPTVLTMMGLPAADDMPGRVLEEAFDPEWLARVKPAERIESYGVRSSHGTAVRRKDEEEAMLERLQALGYVSGGSTGLKRLAGSHFSKGEFDQAIGIWNDILLDEPGNAEVMTSIGNALLQKGEIQQAIETLQEAVAANPGHLPARNMLGMCYINLNRLDDALESATEVLALDPGNPEAYFNLGVVYRLQGYYDRALSAFARSVELRGDYDESRINLASEHVRRGNFEAARAQALKALEINPKSIEAMYLMGRIYQGTRNADSAAFWYRETLSRGPAYTSARIALASILASRGQLDEARLELETGLENTDETHIIHVNLGLISRQMGDLDTAESHFKEALEAEPGFTPAMLDLADLYIARGRQDRARRQIETALEVDPGNERARRLAESIR